MADTATVMVLMRGLHLAAALSLLDTMGFIVWMPQAASAAADPFRGRLIRLWWIGGAVALLAGLVWFTLQAAAIADAGTISEVLTALPLVAIHTRYGNILMMRSGLLLMATLVGLRAARLNDSNRITGPACLTLILTAIALGLQGFLGHAGAITGWVGDSLVLFEALHLLAAGVWLGALLPLWLGLRMLSAAQAATLCERFSPIGLACVLVLAGTGLVQCLELIGGLSALVGTPYGHIALLKIVLFVFALGLAAANRLWLTDRLAAGASRSRRHLSVSVGIETMIGLAIVTAAAFLASSSPGTHQAPVWPFPWRFALVKVNEGADAHQHVSVSLIAIAAAVAFLAGALLARRYRLLTMAVLAAWGGPFLSLLTAKGGTTSFLTSSTEFSTTSIARSKVLFARTCIARPGAEAEGDRPAAAHMRIKPAGLTSPLPIKPHTTEQSSGVPHEHHH